MSEEPSIYFTQPESISEGDIVWIYEGWRPEELIGPLFVEHYSSIGYGSNKRLIYKLVDTSTGSWYSSERKWLRVPKETV